MFSNLNLNLKLSFLCSMFDYISRLKLWCKLFMNFLSLLQSLFFFFLFSLIFQYFSVYFTEFNKYNYNWINSLTFGIFCANFPDFSWLENVPPFSRVSSPCGNHANLTKYKPCRKNAYQYLELVSQFITMKLRQNYYFIGVCTDTHVIYQGFLFLNWRVDHTNR